MRLEDNSRVIKLAIKPVTKVREEDNSRVIKLAIKPVTKVREEDNSEQQGNQSGSGLAQNETGGNETGGNILEQTGEAISKTFGGK